MEKIAHNISDAAGQNQQVGWETIHREKTVQWFWLSPNMEEDRCLIHLSSSSLQGGAHGQTTDGKPTVLDEVAKEQTAGGELSLHIISIKK